MAPRSESRASIDRALTSPFSLRLFWRTTKSFEPWEFSVQPPSDLSGITDHAALLPSLMQQQSLQLYTWSDCSLAELADLFTSTLRNTTRPGANPSVGTRLAFKLIFPDANSSFVDGRRGKWAERAFGSIVIGGRDAELGDDGAADDDADDNPARHDIDRSPTSDAQRTLADVRFVVGDYIACCILPPGPDSRIAPTPTNLPSRGQQAREPAFGPHPYRGSGARMHGSQQFDTHAVGINYRNGFNGRHEGLGAQPPPGDWRRGERLPNPPDGGPHRGGSSRGYGRGRGY